LQKWSRMHESVTILTLTAGLAAALVLGFLTHRLGFSPIVGYLLAGLLIGPYTPGFVADHAIANEFAEIGVILLMFGVGLHFHIKDLLAVRTVAITGALCQSAAATVLGALAGRAVGWSWSASIVFGLALSVASTVMLIRVLTDNQHLQTPTGRIALGWLVVEDVLTVIVLVLLPAMFGGPEASSNTTALEAIAATLLKLAILVAVVFIIGGRAIPRILNASAGTQSRELFTLTVLALALGIAVGSAIGFGVSMALGAFLAGMIVGQSEFSFRAASEALPMRDAFAVLFFVSVGMVFDPSSLVQAPGLLLATLAIILIGKPVAAWLIVVALGYGSKVAAGVALALAQIGEFSLILATLGDRLGLFPAGATNIIVAAALVSLTLNPMQYKFIPKLETALEKFPRLWKLANYKRLAPQLMGDGDADTAAYRVVIVGYGPVGRTLSRLLHDSGLETVVIEANLASVRLAQTHGHLSVYGNAERPEVLGAAGIDKAVGLVVAGPTAEQSAEIIRLARKTNPDLRILARSTYLRDTTPLRSAGANAVFSGEGEVALAMTEYMLGVLGATPEQMDRERQRVRNEIFPLAQPTQES
jgi:CPA2 family monovalent cation:H+ antiporter-2